MKVNAQRTTMPFDNRGFGGPALTPPTNKSTFPYGTGYTIEDLLHGKSYEEYQKIHGGGDWTDGYEEKSYREEGDDFMRREKDEAIIKKMLTPSPYDIKEKWVVRVQGGSVNFVSLDQAQEYVKKLKLKNIPYSFISRVASSSSEDQGSSMNVISDSISKCFMVESIVFSDGVKESGSSFCVAPNYFVTCAHVIKKYNKNVDRDESVFKEANVSIVNQGERYAAELVAVDLAKDIALLKSPVDCVPFRVSEKDDEDIGADILAVGSPHGYENNVSTGTLGSVNRQVYFYKDAPPYMFVDLAVFPGNSGGPVINRNTGEVIGLVTLIISDIGAYGLNAALPASYIYDFCKKNIEGF